MVKALSFKGDKKAPKKRKRTTAADEDDGPTNKQLTLAGQDGPAEAEEDENWVSADAVSDLAGPAMLVLTSEPVMSLACDQLGKVFPLKVENMVEGVSGSAEPHDVRQVWVVTRVVGSETEVVFKGCNGRYLGCDKLGIMSTSREAISPEETFKCLPHPTKPGLFTLQTVRSTYLSIDTDSTPPVIRGDTDPPSAEGADDIPENCELRIRMQARFKPKNKVEKAEKVRAKISRKELEDEVGRRLEDDEVKRLKKARREGDFHEVMLDVKVKGKHDKFA